MRVAIFGATGRTGQVLVEQALGLGHEVTACARDPRALAIKHDRLRTVPGDILDPAAVDASVAGQDVVISALGQTNPGPGSVLSTGTGNMIRAMERRGVRRLICQSAIGVGDSKGQGGLIHHCLIVPFFLRFVYADKERQERAVKRSGLDWVIVRPSRLVDGPVTGTYRVSLGGGTVLGKITRADVAAFMLGQLTNSEYLHKSPAIGA